jgi:flagellar motility protein MotE (MotC chaperone)
MSLKRHPRLLPGVMLVCSGLLVLNGSGLVHEALAGPGASTAADAMAAPPVPANKDFAGDDSTIASAAEVDVLSSLSKRRNELDARESQLRIQANMLAATETRVDAKIAQLKQLQMQIATLLAQRDAAQEKQVLALVKTYSAMKPKDAARIFDALSDEVLVPVAEEMKSDVLAPVLAAMNADRAQKLTVKLASKLTLPDAPPAAPAQSAAAGQQAQANPLPAANLAANAPSAAPAPPAKIGN